MVPNRNVDAGAPKPTGPRGFAAARAAMAQSTVTTEKPQSKPKPLRIGDKVRSLVDDVCVSVGLVGIVVNVAPPRYGLATRARVLWDNETVSMADSDTFELVPKATEQDPSTDESKAS
ncbi:MAG: hypothetical protein WBP12_05100 [Candidatus Saccharimonas sp.]